MALPAKLFPVGCWAGVVVCVVDERRRMAATTLPPVVAPGGSLSLTSTLPVARPGMLPSSQLIGAVDGDDVPQRFPLDLPLGGAFPGQPLNGRVVATVATTPVVQIPNAWEDTAVPLPESGAGAIPRCVAAALESSMSVECQTGISPTQRDMRPPLLPLVRVVSSQCAAAV